MATLRSKSFRRLTAAALALAASAPASADTVLVVGAGQPFATIQAAVDAASDGDVVLVKSGIYPDPVSVVQKGITIVGDAPPVVIVQGEWIVRDLLPHQTVLLVRLRLSPSTGTSTPGLRVENTTGSVRVEDCTLYGPYACYGCSNPGGPAVSATDAWDVTFVDCTIKGGDGASTSPTPSSGGNGVNLLRSRAALYGCQVIGGHGGEGDTFDGGEGGDGGHGLYLSDSSPAPFHTLAFVSGSTIRGGDGGYSFWPACSSHNGAGGHGVSGSGLVAGSSLVVLDSTLQGGSGACGEPNGQANTIPTWTTNLPGTAQQAFFESPRREGQTITVRFTGTPGRAAWLIGNDAPGFTYLPTLGSVLHVDRAHLRPTFAGILPASGTLELQLVAPQLPAGVESRRLYLQALFYDPTGRRTFGIPLMPLVLDGAF